MSQKQNSEEKEEKAAPAQSNEFELLSESEREQKFKELREAYQR